MMSNKKKNNYLGKIESTPYSSIFALFVLAFVSSIVPLVVLMKVVPLQGIMQEAWTGTTSQVDFFSYWKSRLIIVVLCVLVLYWIYRIVKRLPTEKLPLLIPFCIYLFMVLVSSIFAQYKDVAFFGFADRFEGMYVLLSYGVIFLTSLTVVKSEKQAEPLIICILLSCFLISVLGLTQFYNIDFLQTDFGKKLILPKAYESMASSLKFIFSGKKIMYTTVYNPDYLGSYSALLLPVAIGLFFNWVEQKSWKKILGLIFSAAAFILFLGGMSNAGLIGGGLGLLIMLILFRKTIIKRWYAGLILVGLFAGIYITMDFTSTHAITKELTKTFTSSQSTASNAIEEKGSASDGSQASMPSTYVTDLKLKGKTFTFGTKTEQINITTKDNNLVITDSAGKDLALTLKEDKYVFEDKQYALYAIEPFQGGFQLLWNNMSIPVVYSTDGLLIQVKQGQYINTVDHPETFGFKGMERFASGRGYIWSRSIPMFKKTLFLGYGPDTYAIYFPQNELDAKMNFLDNPIIVVDKPHSWYLQLGINTGVISLLAMIAFLGWYWFKGLFVWIKDLSGSEKIIGASIFCGITGYLAASIGNDSVVSVAPVFWVLLGIGVSLVSKYSPSKKINQESGSDNRKGISKPGTVTSKSDKTRIKLQGL